jgi:hypothetical protein
MRGHRGFIEGLSKVIREKQGEGRLDRKTIVAKKYRQAKWGCEGELKRKFGVDFQDFMWYSGDRFHGKGSVA